LCWKKICVYCLPYALVVVTFVPRSIPSAKQSVPPVSIGVLIICSYSSMLITCGLYSTPNMFLSIEVKDLRWFLEPIMRHSNTCFMSSCCTLAIHSYRSLMSVSSINDPTFNASPRHFEPILINWL